jgi:nitroreductase
MKNLYSLSNAFEIISRSRIAEKQFSEKSIEGGILKKIIELTQLAPSSFNLQPYKIIIVKNKESRSLLSNSMLGLNSEKVKTAPVTIVFAADKGAFESLNCKINVSIIKHFSKLLIIFIL